MSLRTDISLKRPRFSSSESDSEKPKPVSKQQRKNMADETIMETAKQGNNGQARTNVNNVQGNTSGQSEVVQLLNKLQRGQDELQASLSTQISTIKTEMIKTIDTKMKTMKKKFDEEMSMMSSDIARVAARVEQIERTSTNRDNNPSDDAKFGKIVVIKNLPVAPVEDEDTLRQVFRAMVVEMGLNPNDVNVTRAERVNRGSPGKPKAVLITLDSTEQRTAVMRNKRKLRNSEPGDFKEVFIDPWQPKQERMLQANLRMIAKAVPSLEMKGGRLVTK
jgi:hypothetical protein